MENFLNKVKEIWNKVVEIVKSNRTSKKTADPAETTFNKRAQGEYAKKLEEFTAQNGAPTAEQEAILYAQAYQMQITKNPAAAKFPVMEEFTVSVNEGVYTVAGYLDATNSYGAQVRGDMKLNLINRDGKWICTDKHTSLQKIYLYFLLGCFLLSMIAYFYYMSKLSKF